MLDVTMAIWFSISILIVGALPGSYSRPDKQQILSDETSSHPDHVLPRLNFSSSSPLIFHSTFSLLQQWPNTFFPNGHTIAPCSVPKNTRLYHARADGDLPPSPEWIAFDPEMSYAILGSLQNSHLLTYRTTRELRCLYFDGQSAALMFDGFMDSQMVFLYNNSASVPEDPVIGPIPDKDCLPNPPVYNSSKDCKWHPLQREYERAEGLCDYIRDKRLGGLGWGYEGIVRMNAGFEMIVCNFSSPSLALISHVNVSAPILEGVSRPSLPPLSSRDTGLLDQDFGRMSKRKPVHGYPVAPIKEPFIYDSWARWYTAAAKRYGFAGGRPGRSETRVRIDSCNLFSFYDPLLVDQEWARVVDEKRKLNISSLDGTWVRSGNDSEVAAALQKLSRRRRYQRANNVSVTDGIAMRMAVEQRLRASLHSAESECSGIDWVSIAQDIVSANSDGLHELSTVLSNLVNSTGHDNLRRKLVRVRDVAHSFAMPYYAYSPWTKQNATAAFAWTRPESVAAINLCIAQIDDTEIVTTDAERVTHQAISDTQAAICRTTISLFLDLEAYWLAHYNNVTAPPPPKRVRKAILASAARWLQAVEELMAWLGWSEQWTTCDPGCGSGEICSTYMWPVGDLQPPVFEAVNAPWRPRSQEELERMLERAVFEPVCARPEEYTESWESFVQRGRVG